MFGGLASCRDALTPAFRAGSTKVKEANAVCLVDPRLSPEALVQIAGRAMRKFDGKDEGYLLLPMFLSDEASDSWDGYVWRQAEGARRRALAKHEDASKKKLSA